MGGPSPKPLEGMRAEHLSGKDSSDTFVASNYDVPTSSEIEWHFVTDDKMTPAKLKLDAWPSESVAKLPDLSLCRKRRPLADVERAAEAPNARLKKDGHPELITVELIAAILYTGPVRPRLVRHTLPAHHPDAPSTAPG